MAKLASFLVSHNFDWLSFSHVTEIDILGQYVIILRYKGLIFDKSVLHPMILRHSNYY